MKKPIKRLQQHCESCGRRTEPNPSARPRALKCSKCREAELAHEE